MLLALACAGTLLAQSGLQKIEETVVDPHALVLAADAKFGRGINGQAYQQAGLLTYAGWQYAAYYDAERRVCLARRKLPDGPWQKLAFEDFRYPAENTHDTISFGISEDDGRIHLSFSQHAIPLRYRVSQPGVATNPEAHAWTPGVFGEITNRLGNQSLSSVTYPVFLSLPDGDLLFGWREGSSGNGENRFARYASRTGEWSEPWTITSRAGTFQDELGTSDSRCAYLNDQEITPDGRLHITLCWREKAPTANHGLAYMVSADGGRTWRDNQGNTLETPVRVDSPDLAVLDIPRRLGLMNQCGQTVDSAGRVHVLMYQMTEKTFAESARQSPWGPPVARRYIHSWRSAEGEWKQNELPGPVGTRPKVVADPEGNLYAIAVVPETGKPFERGLYLSRGQLVVYRATVAKQWKDWEVIHREPGPFLTEPVIDLPLWRKEGLLSLFVQDSGESSSPLRLYTFRPQ